MGPSFFCFQITEKNVDIMTICWLHSLIQRWCLSFLCYVYDMITKRWLDPCNTYHMYLNIKYYKKVVQFSHLIDDTYHIYMNIKYYKKMGQFTHLIDDRKRIICPSHNAKLDRKINILKIPSDSEYIDL